MITIKDYNDAIKEFYAIGKPRHALHCKRMDPEHCFQNNAILSHPDVVASKVYQEFTYIWFKGDDLPTRYWNSPQARYFAGLNDGGGRKAIIDEIRDEFKDNGAVRIRFDPPTGVRSKKHLRSPQMKAMRKASYIKNKGKPKRKYTKPSTSGMRSGSGRSHIWNI